MKKQTDAPKQAQKKTKKTPFSWIIRAADRQQLPRRPAGNCDCK